MSIRSLVLLGTIVTFVSGCQTWQPDKMPPTAASPQVSVPGVVQARYWDNVRGGSVSNLLGLEAYPDNPDEVSELSELRSPENRGDNYGSLVRGFIVPPADGVYQFFVTGDNETQFWLSTDETPDNAEMIALMPGAAAPNNYSQYSSQASGTIELTADTRYYFEIRHKERSGGDHFSVAWEGPGISRQIIAGDSIASLGQSPYGQDGALSGEDIETAYSLGYRIGFFDGTQGLDFGSQYPPRDQDQDGIYDNWETFHGLNPNDPEDATTDADNDFLNALDEFWLGSSPTNPDSDGDGIPDGVEFANELNPLNPEDAQEDLDGDGATNLEEHNANTSIADASETPALTDTETNYVPGFVGQYFQGTDFSQFVMTREDSSIDFAWGRRGPAAEMPSDEFSVRWNGIFTAPHNSGTREYEFTTTTDDGVRLYIDNQLVIDQWQGQGATPYSSTISLAGGESVPVTMEYFDGCCGATARLTITDLSNDQELSVTETVSAPAPEAAATGGRDSDSDGIPDSWELAHGLSPWSPDASASVNNSGVSNIEAYRSGLDPWQLETVGEASPPPPIPAPAESVTPGLGEVTLSWTAPLTRADGSSISLSEIQSYEVKFGQGPDELDQTVTVDGAETSTTISGLESGTWHFAIRAIDNQGLASPLTDPVAHEID